MGENVCVHEQMIVFTEDLNIKQYVKSGQSEKAYDFLAYQGKSIELSVNSKREWRRSCWSFTLIPTN